MFFIPLLKEFEDYFVSSQMFQLKHNRIPDFENVSQLKYYSPSEDNVGSKLQMFTCNARVM